MSFPLNPVDGDTYTNANGITYKYKNRTWVAVNQGLSPLDYSIGYDEPSDPVVGDFWLNTANTNLFMYIFDGVGYYWKQLDNSPVISVEPPNNTKPGVIWYNPITKTLYYYVTYNNESHWEVLASLDNEDSRAILANVLPLSWLYSRSRMNFELFSNTSLAYKWRDVNPIKITSASVGDDTIDVENTNELKEGSQYVVFGDNGPIEYPVIKTILSPTKIRVFTDLSHNLNETSNAYIGRTSFSISNDGNEATVKDKDIFFSKQLNALEFWKEGYVVIRRMADGLGTFVVSYRTPGEAGFTISDIEKITITEDTLYRDEFFYIPLTNTLTEIKIEFLGIDSNTTDKIKHIVLFGKQLSEEILRMERPINISPFDMETLVSTTPTLTGSPFRHLYDVDQNGAEFQIATDKYFNNLILNTSTAYLSGWVHIGGQTANFTSGVSLGERKFVLVGDSGTVKITNDGGSTFSNGAFGDTTNITDIACNRKSNSDFRLIAVGKSAKIKTSSDGGSTWVQQTVAGGYSSDFNGCAAGGFTHYAVGKSGEIQRSTNNGVIWFKMTQDNAYLGDFSDIACTSDGTRAIAVGTSGVIQTTPNGGTNWVSRSPAGGYNKKWYRVAMTDEGFAIAVGEDAEVQISSDFGSTWIKSNVDAGYTGNINGVDIVDNIALFVGDGGEIQSSYDKGVTWTHRIPSMAESGDFKTAIISVNDDYYSLIAGDTGIVQKSMRLEGEYGTAYTVPEASDLLKLNTVYWWRLRYKDNVDFWSEWSIPTVFATRLTIDDPPVNTPLPEIRYIKQPSNMVPADNSKNISTTPVLQSSAFSFVGPADTHSKSQWQISSSKDFNSTVYDSGEVNDLVSIEITSGAGLVEETKYYWRVRYKGTEVGFSAWSAPTSFSVSKIPNTPSIIYPTDNSDNISTVLTVSSSSFSSDSVGETHIKSQWQISTVSDFSTLTFDSHESANLTTISIGGGILSPLVKYYFRVRHKGKNTGWSGWSSTVNATTSGTPEAPTIVSPTNNAVNIPLQPTISTSAFSPKIYGEVHVKSQYRIYIEPGTTVYDSGEVNDLLSHRVSNPAALTWKTEYWVQARHKGSITGWSAYGSAKKFTTSVMPGEQVYTTPGTFTFTVPEDVTVVSVIGYSAGATANLSNPAKPVGGGGGACAYYNNISVTPGQQIPVKVGGYGNSQPNSTEFGGWISIQNASGKIGSQYTGGTYSNRGGGSGGNGGDGIVVESSGRKAPLKYGGGGGGGGRPGKDGGNGSSYSLYTHQIWQPPVIVRVWVLHATTILDWLYVLITGMIDSITGSTSTSQPLGSTYTKRRVLQSTYTLNGSHASSGYGWMKCRNETYKLVESNEEGKYITVSDYQSLNPGLGGGVTGHNGVGGSLMGGTGDGSYGGGAGSVYLPQNGGLRIIWGNDRTFPNNAA